MGTPQILLSLGLPMAYAHVAMGFALAFVAVRLAHRVLDLLRDYRDFRAGR